MWTWHNGAEQQAGFHVVVRLMKMNKSVFYLAYINPDSAAGLSVVYIVTFSLFGLLTLLTILLYCDVILYISRHLKDGKAKRSAQIVLAVYPVSAIEIFHMLYSCYSVTYSVPLEHYNQKPV